MTVQYFVTYSGNHSSNLYSFCFITNLFRPDLKLSNYTTYISVKKGDMKKRHKADRLKMTKRMVRDMSGVMNFNKFQENLFDSL